MSENDTATTHRWLSKAEAAEHIGVHPNTLDRFHALGTGPRRVKLGEGSRSAVRYRLDELDRWMDTRSA